jgi:hypothetical protein
MKLFPSNFLIGFYVHFELKREIKRSLIDVNINGVNFNLASIINIFMAANNFIACQVLWAVSVRDIRASLIFAE